MKKILIADDEPHVSMLLKQFLQRSGYQVTTVLNGEQALASLNNEMADVIITDVQMPKMNGIQLCEALLSDLSIQPSLIIMMTSRTDRDIRTWAELYPVIEFIEKPLSMKRLLNQLTEFFTDKQVNE
jgi:CheY-like chemotaxis protein